MNTTDDLLKTTLAKIARMSTAEVRIALDLAEINLHAVKPEFKPVVAAQIKALKARKRELSWRARPIGSCALCRTLVYATDNPVRDNDTLFCSLRCQQEACQ